MTAHDEQTDARAEATIAPEFTVTAEYATYAINVFGPTGQNAMHYSTAFDALLHADDAMTRAGVRKRIEYDGEVAFTPWRTIGQDHRRTEPSAPTPDDIEYAKRYTDIDGSPYRQKVSLEQAKEHNPTGHRANGSPYWNYVLVQRRRASPWVEADL